MSKKGIFLDSRARNDRRDDAPLINDRIRASRVQLITHEGQNVGVVTKDQAMQLADAVGLDLVLLNDSGDTPVCKIMDHGKALYERKKKLTESKKKQKIIKVKELKFRPKIGSHDFETKVNQATVFLKDGMRVKMTLVFRGRENINKDQKGKELFERINEELEGRGLKGLMHEKDSFMGQFWSRVYYIK